MKKQLLKKVFLETLPVMTGYLVLGMGFGFTMKMKGFGFGWSVMMSTLIYAGSMQYLAIDLFCSGASLMAVALTTLLVNARHLFYGISMLGKYQETGKRKPYLFFSLTDETYSLVCTDKEDFSQKDRNDYYFAVSLLNHLYWITGTAIGSAIGSAISINTEGIDFALTALFATVFVDQWLHSRNHFPAITGLVSSILALLIFGRDAFLIPAMALIVLILYLTKDHKAKGDEF